MKIVFNLGVIVFLLALICLLVNGENNQNHFLTKVEFAVFVLSGLIMIYSIPVNK